MHISTSLNYHRKCCVNISAQPEGAVKLLQSAAGGPLHFRHDLPAYHAAGVHQEPRARDLRPHHYLLLLPLPPQCNRYDELHIHDHSHWIREVSFMKVEVYYGLCRDSS